MDRKWLERIQKAGWYLLRVSEKEVVASCPAHGCGMKAKLREGGPIPWVDPDGRRNRLDMEVASEDSGRKMLRFRREELGLAMDELEDLVGLTPGHVNKLEKDNPDRGMSLQMFIDLSEALGFEVVVRPREMPLKTLSYLAGTRHLYEKRRRRFARERARRG